MAIVPGNLEKWFKRSPLVANVLSELRAGRMAFEPALAAFKECNRLMDEAEKNGDADLLVDCVEMKSIIAGHIDEDWRTKGT